MRENKKNQTHTTSTAGGAHTGQKKADKVGELPTDSVH